MPHKYECLRWRVVEGLADIGWLAGRAVMLVGAFLGSLLISVTFGALALWVSIAASNFVRWVLG